MQNDVAKPGIRSQQIHVLRSTPRYSAGGVRGVLILRKKCCAVRNCVQVELIGLVVRDGSNVCGFEDHAERQAGLQTARQLIGSRNSSLRSDCLQACRRENHIGTGRETSRVVVGEGGHGVRRRVLNLEERGVVALRPVVIDSACHVKDQLLLSGDIPGKAQTWPPLRSTVARQVFRGAMSGLDDAIEQIACAGNNSSVRRELRCAGWVEKAGNKS